ncbi:hypothetical protein Celaphus_00012825, partial [Cervus elaphus hippelaphus]
MVCDESHHILALSEYRGPPHILSRSEPSAPLECLPLGGQGLLEAAPAPKEHPTPGPQKGEKASSNMGLAWRGDYLQAVLEACEKEREMLSVDLWPQLCGLGPGGCSSLLERLEKVVHEQGDQQERSLEHLCLSDRSSLLSEIQALRAQLRMTHLQNQEKLQQLCTALTSAEARGSRQEHRLRRQVELLAYKVEQEKCIASDLQKTLNEEQEKANNVRKLLVVEQNAVRDLKSELCECRQDNERLLKSLNDVQKEVLQLRSVLDSKESDLQAALRQLEGERTKEQALQSQLEEERLQHMQREGQSAKTLEELRASLEQQCAQSNQLCVVLKHEQTAKDNLRQELQIEASRCEALLAQERGHMSELQRSLEAERDRTRELSEALQHERVLTERLSRRPQEKPAHQALLQKLRAQEERVHELEVALEAAQRRALEAEAHVHREEVEREQERELELQRQRDEHKIHQLQRTVQELQARAALPSSASASSSGAWRRCGSSCSAPRGSSPASSTRRDWTSSNEKAVASLLHTLETLKSELGTSSSCRKKTAAELQIQLVDVLLKDNESLSRALSTVTREKAELCKALSRLERTHRAPRTLQEGCTRKRSDRSAWKQDKMVPQGSARHPDPALDAGACSAKMEKLYLRYLRAESFRKALIYQKKYLLLLIGGFQDSEQETLSMIAHLGVFPSKADRKAAESRPFTRFRTAVRVVIAVLRLRFLVKKWQQVDGRGALAPGQALHPGEGFLVPQRQQSPPVTRESPPTRDVSSSQARDPVPKVSPRRRERSSPLPNPRSERSLTASQDPEHSLTEYIHHLEMIQQRLGGMPPDSTSKKSSCQKIKQSEPSTVLFLEDFLSYTVKPESTEDRRCPWRYQVTGTGFIVLGLCQPPGFPSVTGSLTPADAGAPTPAGSEGPLSPAQQSPWMEQSHRWKAGTSPGLSDSIAELQLGDIKESQGHEPSMYFCCEKNFLSEAVMVSKEFGKSLEDSQQEQQVHLQNRRGPGTGTPHRHSTGTLQSCSCHNSHLLDPLASSYSLPPLHHHPNVLQYSFDTTREAFCIGPVARSFCCLCHLKDVMQESDPLHTAVVTRVHHSPVLHQADTLPTTLCNSSLWILECVCGGEGWGALSAAPLPNPPRPRTS